jgi:hypothetical protein
MLVGEGVEGSILNTGEFVQKITAFAAANTA